MQNTSHNNVTFGVTFTFIVTQHPIKLFSFTCHEFTNMHAYVTRRHVNPNASLLNSIGVLNFQTVVPRIPELDFQHTCLSLSPLRKLSFVIGLLFLMRDLFTHVKTLGHLPRSVFMSYQKAMLNECVVKYMTKICTLTCMYA
jgi:hypothetical protein